MLCHIAVILSHIAISLYHFAVILCHIAVTLCHIAVLCAVQMKGVVKDQLIVQRSSASYQLPQFTDALSHCRAVCRPDERRDWRPAEHAEGL
jgi:hypothetical protein